MLTTGKPQGLSGRVLQSNPVLSGAMLAGLTLGPVCRQDSGSVAGWHCRYVLLRSRTGIVHHHRRALSLSEKNTTYRTRNTSSYMYVQLVLTILLHCIYY